MIFGCRFQDEIMKNIRVHNYLYSAATENAHGIALIEQSDKKITWCELLAATEDAVKILQKATIKPGDRVVIAFENCIEMIAFFYATSILEGTVVAVNARVTPVELARIFDHADPGVVIFTSKDSNAAASHAQTHSAQVTDGLFGQVSVLERSAAVSEAVFDDAKQQVALLLYTSGTTGTPKAAMLTHSNLMEAVTASVRQRKFNNKDVVFMALPLSHVFGLVTFLAVSCSQGTMRLEASYSVERLHQLLHLDLTVFPGVPQMIAHLIHYAQSIGKPQCSSDKLRLVTSGGAPLDPAWKRDAEFYFGVPLQNGYGMTEAAAGICTTDNALGDPDISVGTATGNNTLKLDFDASGAQRDQGIGEIILSGPQVMKGYFRNPEQTALVFTKEGGYRTGDLGRFDEKLRLHIVGRSKELIIRSGFNVYPVEIEGVFTEHKDVIAAAVVGRKVTGNEEVIAFLEVTATCDLDEAAFKAFSKKLLSPYKVPSRIIITNKLPAATTGKILKNQLLTAFANELVIGNH